MCVEYLAIVAFTQAGWEVFHNASPDGPADLVVWDGENTYLIDTKKTKKYVNKTGGIYYRKQESLFVEGVHYLGHDGNEFVWLSEPPEALSNAI